MGATSRQVTFGRFRLDAASERLWAGADAVALRPKAFAVLQYLVEHAGELVTKQQLLEAVWPATFVSDAVLKDSIRQLREALADDPASPRFIETAHRRGYRFIGQITPVAVAESNPVSTAGAATAPAPATYGPPVFVERRRSGRERLLGRDAELAKMRGWFERALRGERQVIFVTGEPGIGKTTIVNAWLEEASALPDLWIARGQCFEQYGSSEAYLPVLDGFSRLGRAGAADGSRVIDLLRQHAPAWLLELPSLLSQLPAADREALRQQVPGATRERMLREMAGAVEAMTASAPLILVLEDLHWSDYSTLDLIAYLARRRDPARLIVIGTYRPVEVILGDHPLKSVKRELQAHRLCQELPLEYLTEDDVAQYLAGRFSRHALPRRVAKVIHQRTEGNPLFMVNVVQYLVDEQVIVQRGEDQENRRWELRDGFEAVESGVPENVRQLIERQVERLSPDERRVLEGASCVGMECSSRAIAAGLDESAAWVEEHCEALVRRHQFLSPARLVELPDGTITPRYKFSHMLYLEVPYHLLPPMRRAQIHGRIGACGEAVYGKRVGEIANELAMHFEQARDLPRAVTYLLMAADNATHHSAHHEAMSLARRGLQALAPLPDTPERAKQEFTLRAILAVSLMAIKGVGDAELDETCTRALELCGRRASPQAFMAWWLRGLVHYHRAELQSAVEICAQLREMANGLPESLLLVEAHRATGVTFVELGRFREAMPHLNRVSALYETSRHHAYASFVGHDPKVVSDCFAARALWALGDPDGALARIDEGVALARTLGHALSLVLAIDFAAHIHQLRGEPARTRERADEVIALADEYGLELWSAFGHIYRGWASAQRGEVDEGVQELRSGLAAYDATGARLWRASFAALLAESLGRAGQAEEGLTVLADALASVRRSGEQYPTAELLRLQGELLMARGRRAEATRSLEQALAVAREQEAVSWQRKVAASIELC